MHSNSLQINFIVPLEKFVFAERVYNTNIIIKSFFLKHCSHYEPAGNRLLTNQKKAAHQKFLNGHVMGFKTFVIYTDGGDSNTAEKY